ncbi:hypothetical protein JBL43_16215 [Aureibaculum sp. A20]|uniref:DUF676 domain-containing protein n=1 Tax=Aureibaculum flavum TaxID=2795986 RepID=A0ABS0WUX9_9FLAO|nr:hypothetical protein [Aureibaculum flavum]MBJ2175800.1 hypothetical protein [Aureibaculum flavum]
MKKQLLLSIVFLIGIISEAQIVPIDKKESLDHRLSNIDLSSVNSGIIYERVTPYANLYNFNKSKEFNTATKAYMVQAMSELHRASNQTMFVSANGLKERIYNTIAINEVDIAILNADFDILNYNEKEPHKGGLLFDANIQKFSQIKEKPTFFPFHTTIIAAMKNKVVGNSITFNIKNDLFYNKVNENKQIKTLSADFGNGKQHILINEYNLKKQQISIPYRPSQEGELTLIFNITYKDNNVVTTKAKLKLKYASGQFKKLANVNCDTDRLKEDHFIISDYSFKGYEESFAFNGRSDYRIFYDKIKNDKVLNKPLIIIDGFDPQDKRKILRCDYDFYREGKDRAVEDVMNYYNLNDAGELEEIPLINQLRLKGYDVIIVNNTNYCVEVAAPHAISTDLYDEENNRCTQPGWNLIDGGADYIERNGLNLVSLIQHINTAVATNGSNEELVIVGPSMGGQISRYALAYMEKNQIPHNTRLWVSVDSPHLGANIPMGAQALLNLLKEDGNDKATEFYEKQLGSVAARQQLIEFHQQRGGNYHLVNQDNLNGRVASQGFPRDDGSEFYRKYYNNLQNNGLEGSDGYPQNLRKIALVNGSLTGSKALKDNATGNVFGAYDANSTQTVNIRGFNKVCVIGCWDVHTASMESHTMPYNGGDERIARFKKGFNDRTTRSPNINSRGNMDIVPGGFFNAYDEIHTAIMGESSDTDWTVSTMGMNLGFYVNDWGIGLFFDEKTTRLESRKNSRFGSFIPTFSAIAHKNPNQNWKNPLNRNLVYK